MRRTLVITSLLIVLLAACSSSAKTDQTTPTSSAPTATQPTIPATPPTSPASPITISAHIVAVNLPAHTITVDPIAFLTGPAAVAAFRHDNPGATDGPPNDYYIQNPTKDRVELKLPADAVVQLVHVKESSDQTHAVTVPQSRLAGYQPLSFAPFKITARAGTVQSVVEIFVP